MSPENEGGTMQTKLRSDKGRRQECTNESRTQEKRSRTGLQLYQNMVAGLRGVVVLACLRAPGAAHETAADGLLEVLVPP